MNYGKVGEPGSSRSRRTNTARRAATSAILTVISSRSDRASRTSHTVDGAPVRKGTGAILTSSRMWRSQAELFYLDHDFQVFARQHQRAVARSIVAADQRQQIDG